MITCYYHHNCIDGISAAWQVSKQISDATFVPIQYGWEINNKTLGLESDILLFVDYCPGRDQIDQLLPLIKGKEIVILDHHKTAPANANYLSSKHPNVKYLINQQLSGAGIASVINIPEFITSAVGDDITLGSSITNVPAFGEYLTTTIDSINPGLIRSIIIRDIWIGGPGNAEFEEASTLNAAFEIRGLRSTPPSESFKILDDFSSPELMKLWMEIGRNGLEKKRQKALSLIERGAVFYLHDSEGELIRFIITTGEDVASEIGGAFCSGDEPSVAIVISHDYATEVTIASIRSSKNVNGLAIAKIIDPVNGGGHSQACGGRFSTGENTLYFLRNLLATNVSEISLLEKTDEK